MNCKRNTMIAMALLGCAVAGNAVAAEEGAKQVAAPRFSYNYLQAAYVDLDSDFDGLKLDGSFGVTPDLALTAGYMMTGTGSRDYDVLSLGVAYHQHLADVPLPHSDLVLHGEFQHASLDVRCGGGNICSNDDSGLRFGAKLRYLAQRNIELFGDLSYTSLYNNDLALSGGINLALTQQFSVVASIELSDDDMLLFGARMNFK